MPHASNYIEDLAIHAELVYAERLMRNHGWRCIDVSYKAVEEVAMELLRGPSRVEAHEESR